MQLDETTAGQHQDANGVGLLRSFSRGKKIRVGIILILYTVFVMWGFRQIVPRGLPMESFIAYTYAVNVYGPYTSPDSTVVLTARVNDAGALSGSPFYTWVETHSWVTGKRIVSEGWVEDSAIRPRITWLSDHDFDVRYDAAPKPCPMPDN
ncbi:MAG: hypothetical protein HND57_06435 [Planctomycetes bacterium]|nr:hypothetical protein [Planctomycetota bacterium]